MKRFLPILLLGIYQFSFAQDNLPTEVALGPAYANQVFFSLSDGSTQGHPNTTWDIAFEVFSRQNAGVFVNEAVSLSQGNPIPQLELFAVDSLSFEVVTDSTVLLDIAAGMLDSTLVSERLHNPDESWNEGAFNTVKSPQNPFDFGWGVYDPATNVVSGSQVYLLKLRDSTFKKLIVQSLDSNRFEFRYANLDGSADTTQVVSRSDYAGKTLVYFSFDSESFLDLEPASWDLLFTRYSTPLIDPSTNGILQYIVTGVLSGNGVTVAQVDGIDPTMLVESTIEEIEQFLPDSISSIAEVFNDSLVSIGYDWKSFVFSTFSWNLPEDRIYVVKTANDSLYMLQFIDFEGSSTGLSVFQTTPLGQLSTSSQEGLKKLFSYRSYPNPVRDRLTIAYELDTFIGDSDLKIFDNQGRTVLNIPLNSNLGLNVKDIDVKLPAGTYFVQLQLGTRQISEPLIVLPY
ncbi:MAG: HmuY family protein [Bacteroidota bacterium]